MFRSSQRRRALVAFIHFTNLYLVTSMMLFILADEFNSTAAVVAVKFTTTVYELTGIIGLGALTGLLPAQLYLDVLGVMLFGVNFVKRK